MATYDILIKNGKVFDGSDEENSSATDIGIKGERIEAIGALKDATAGHVIDATDKYVAPGFVDITNHADTHLTMFKFPEMESSLMQGVTTVIGGNCGTSLAPLGNPDAINAVRKWANPGEISVNWANVAEYLTEMQRKSFAVNYGMFAGYGTLRRGVIGDDPKLLSQSERDRIKFLLKDAIKQGAFGLSLGLSFGHERISTTEEIIEIGSVLQETGGIIKLHLRSEGKEILAAVNEAIRIARSVNVPVQISHFKAIGRKSWLHLKRAVDLIERATSGGDVSVAFDVSPYSTTGSLLYLMIPAWARRGGFPDLFKRLDNNEERTKIVDEMKTYTLHYDRLLVTSAKLTNLVGKTVAQISQKSLLTPEETLLDMVRANEGQISIIGRTLSRENTEFALKHAYSLVASDGEGYSADVASEGNLIHPRSFGAFAHFWHNFVIDHRRLKPAEAVQKMSAIPAARVGLTGRGFIKKGYFADVVVFDSALYRDKATYKNPYRYPAGMDTVIVNGKIAVEKGKYLGVRNGKILKKS